MKSCTRPDPTVPLAETLGAMEDLVARRLVREDDNLLAAELVLHDDELRDLGAATSPEPIYPSSMDRSMGFAEPGESTTG